MINLEVRPHLPRPNRPPHDAKGWVKVAVGRRANTFLDRPSSVSGFTLVELAIVLLILGLLLGGLVVPLVTQVNVRKVEETRKSMREIVEALYGYASSNGRLPCPATVASKGIELRRNAGDAVADGCSGGYVGLLPWATLGIAEADAWGRHFRYRVTNEFTRAQGDPTASGICVSPSPVVPGTDPNSCTLEIMDTGDLSVETRDPSTKVKRNLAIQVPAVVISLGANGYGAINLENVAQAAPPASNLDEAQNANPASLAFLSRTPTETQAVCSDSAAGAPFCEFDDIATWVPTSILVSRMIAAGRLP